MTAFQKPGKVGDFVKAVIAGCSGIDAMEHAGEKFHREDWGEIVLWELARAPRSTRVYFTTRLGGVSRSPYASLNLGFHVGDDPGAVRSNRAMLSQILGIDASRISSPRQRHTAEVAMLTPDTIGAGAISDQSACDPCDGLVTDIPDAPILLHYADCVPVVLMAAERGKPAVAVLHAGRQGLMQGVIGNGVRLMRDSLGLAPDSLRAAIGPSIGPCCYEVSEETAREFEGRFGTAAVSSRFLDLRAAAGADLTAAGVDEDSISLLDICTACDPDFYSYRRDGVTGRHGAIAWVE
ncbi:MAG: peptidoglycan editing factor PgeF [Thermoleophilia bacterium]